MNKLENYLIMLHFLFTSMTCTKLHGDMQPIQLGRMGNYIHYHYPIFHVILHSSTFLFQQHFVTLYCISIDIHIGMIHKDKRIFLCTVMFSIHIDSLSFPVSVWLNYIAARKQIMKWMLLTQETTFFVFMVVTQEPTLRKCQLLLMYLTPWKHSLLKIHYQSKP